MALKNGELERLLHRLSSVKAQTAEWEQLVKAKDFELREWNQSLMSRGAELEVAKTELAKVTSYQKQVEEQLKSKDEQLLAVEDRLQKFMTRLHDLDLEAKSKDNELQSVQVRLKEVNARARSHEEQIKFQDIELESLQMKLSETQALGDTRHEQLLRSNKELKVAIDELTKLRVARREVQKTIDRYEGRLGRNSMDDSAASDVSYVGPGGPGLKKRAERGSYLATQQLQRGALPSIEPAAPLGDRESGRPRPTRPRTAGSGGRRK